MSVPLNDANFGIGALAFQTRRYYAVGQTRYGRGRHAVFTCRKQARRSGYRRSVFGRR